MALQRPVEFAGGFVVVCDVAVFFQAIEGVRQRHLLMGFEARSPESAAQLHLAVVDFIQAAQGELGGEDRRDGEGSEKSGGGCPRIVVAGGHCVKWEVLSDREWPRKRG